MKIVSIDVGIKNLAFCFLEINYDSTISQDKSIKIIQWDVINLTQQVELKCCEIEKNVQCNKPAKFKKNSKCYCLKHSKKQQFQVPTSQLKLAYINKQKMNTLCQIADDYKIKYPQPCKKTELISLIHDYIYNKCFEPVETSNASKLDLITIGRNIQYRFDNLLSEHHSTIDKVIIENQISPIANRMKTIQGMIAQYFIMRNNTIDIDFVNATNKLKLTHEPKMTSAINSNSGSNTVSSLTTKSTTENSKTNTHVNANTNPKTNYAERKKQGIQQCLELLSYHNFQSWDDFFKNHKKKDDLADCFLQANWYINNKLLITDVVVSL